MFLLQCQSKDVHYEYHFDPSLEFASPTEKNNQFPVIKNTNELITQYMNLYGAFIFRI